MKTMNYFFLFLLRPFYICIKSIFYLCKCKKLKLGFGVNIVKTRFSSYNYIASNCIISNSVLGDFSYVGRDSTVQNSKIGSFTCIGPGVIVAMGEHPTNYLSIHPMFYSCSKQVGISFSANNKFQEYQKVVIGNDVWVGARAVICSGVSVGDGAIIAAGAVVTKDVLPYHIVAGVPARKIKQRFDDEKVEKLLKVRWWNNFSDDELLNISKNIDNVDHFLDSYESNT